MLAFRAYGVPMDLLMFNIMVASLSLLFFLAFLGIFFYNQQLKAAGWVALAFLFGSLALLVDQNRTVLESYFIDKLAEPLFWSSCLAVVLAYASRVSARPSVPLLGIALFVGLSTMLVISHLPQRAIIMDWVSAAILLAGVLVLWGHRNGVTDKALCYFTLFSAIVAFLRPFIIIADISPGAWTSAFAFYQAVLYLSSSILSTVGANVIFVALGVDLIERHQRDAMVDALTGLLNRRGIDRFLDEKEALRGENSMAGHAVLMFDIDHFKKVNDEFGHEVGDNVLARLGSTIRQLMQYHGTAGRTGGEEFVFLFNRESTNAAFLVAEHVRVAIGMLDHKGLPENHRITISLGLAFVREGEPLKRTMRRADAALYEAKDAGRNRLRIADGDTLPEIDEKLNIPKQTAQPGGIDLPDVGL